jgi:Protein of unknown function (DUF3025)
LAHGLEAIDWSAPWLAPYKNLAEHTALQTTEQTRICDVLNQLPATTGKPIAPVHFVPQTELPVGEPYERYIFNSKQCPTRDGLHDFFNGLCWHTFALTKLRLNQLQAEQIKVLGTVATRGPARDALTVFDENAAFLFAPPALWQALLDKDWQRLFVTLRPVWAQAQLILFGHALLEKLVNPRKPIVAHVYIASSAIKNIVNIVNVLNMQDATKISTAEIDAWVASDLSAEYLASKPFAPLPVLGVPGWWAANEQSDFYDDDTVFRKPRTHAALDF